MATPPGTPRLSHKRASSNGNGNTPNTGARRTRRDCGTPCRGQSGDSKVHHETVGYAQ